MSSCVIGRPPGRNGIPSSASGPVEAFCEASARFEIPGLAVEQTLGQEVRLCGEHRAEIRRPFFGRLLA